MNVKGRSDWLPTQFADKPDFRFEGLEDARAYCHVRFFINRGIEICTTVVDEIDDENHGSLDVVPAMMPISSGMARRRFGVLSAAVPSSCPATPVIFRNHQASRWRSTTSLPWFGGASITTRRTSPAGWSWKYWRTRIPPSECVTKLIGAAAFARHAARPSPTALAASACTECSRDG